MLVFRPEAYRLIQNTIPKTVSTTSTDHPCTTEENRFDSLHLSPTAGQDNNLTFRQMASELSQQVRTYNTTGKVQELRTQVQQNEYQISPREIAARMLLMEGDV